MAINLDENKIKLPKLGWVKAAFSEKQIEAFKTKDDSFKIKGATITRHSNGQWFVTLKLEEIVNLVGKPDVSLISDDEIVGIDVGLTHFAILPDGTKIENPKYHQKSLKRLKSLQKRLSRMKKGSQNYIKQKMKLAKLHLHIKNMRHDFLHKISRKLINENQVIVLEDLNVKGMIKNKNLAKAIQDVGWGTFKTFLTYKSEWDNKHVVFVDRFFPSSKLCGGCREKNVLLSLSEREWICPNCGLRHDRDINAAENIKQEGLRRLTSNLVAF